MFICVANIVPADGPAQVAACIVMKKFDHGSSL